MISRGEACLLFQVPVPWEKMKISHFNVGLSVWEQDVKSNKGHMDKLIN